MEAQRKSNSALGLALLASLLAHVAVILPAVLMVMQTRAGADSSLEAQFEAGGAAAVLAREDPPEIELGIENGQPSSLNWIGYETYEKHLAMLAPTEQPALGAPVEGPLSEGNPGRAGHAGGTPAPTLPTAAATPRETPHVPQDSQPHGQTPVSPAQPPSPQPRPAAASPVAEGPVATNSLAPQALPDGGIDLPPLLRALGLLGKVESDASVRIKPDHAQSQPPSVEDLPAPSEKVPAPTPLAAPGETPAQPTVAPALAPPSLRPERPGEPQDTPQPPRVAPAAPPHPPAPPASIAPPASPSTPSAPPQAPATGQGTPTDKASDPTSIIDVPRESWQQGKPLASEGLELKPRRPVFTTLTLMTAKPCNPLCLIQFRGDGKPAKASLITSACDPRIDQAIETSLYGWRASGEKLKLIGADETLDVKIRIILIQPPD